MEHKKLRVLFLCVHNSARSQMAEALLRSQADHWFDVESAGFEPKPVLPAAVRAMAEIGLDIASAQPKSVFDLYRSGRIYHYVIGVCDEATAETCPIFPGVCQRLHWAFPDPSAGETEEQRLAEAVRVREQIRSRIGAWLAELESAGGPEPTFRRSER